MMQKLTQEFDLGDVLSITTGRLVSPNGIGGIYNILNFMTDESLFTHQLPRVGREAKPVLLFQHPQLSDVDAEGVNKDNWQQWLHEQKARFGDRLSVEKMDRNEHEQIDAMSELAEKVHPANVIVVQS